ncbi:MAG: RNA polymerase subunit sigma-54 [Deltaproteobacteria bacterium]|nr:MAG: RNA polymerase subunit sigma-54 [Deltaproteobacteria bacterium]
MRKGWLYKLSGSDDKKNIEDIPSFQGIVGASDSILKVAQIIEKVSKTDSSILITGESGTGKELIAKAIHHLSKRGDNDLVVINCGAIPPNLLESELFGHEKGAFTGALSSHTGRFERADKGSLFLDEIGDMSPVLQVKLLRAIQEQQFEKVGGSRPVKVDVRFISATNKDLKKAISENEFREDLYYRLNVIPIEVPPLRERRSDITLLARFFLERLAERFEEPVKKLSNEASEILVSYDWPGNIRELENIMEQLAVMSEGPEILPEDIPAGINNKNNGFSGFVFNPIENGISFNEAVDNYQKSLIMEALRKTGWVKAKAAKILQMNRTTLVEKIKKLGLSEDESPENLLF